MPRITFTDNLKRHIDCPPQQEEGETLAAVLNAVFSNHQQLRTYILDDQDRLRKHIMIAIDNTMIQDRVYLSDKVKPDSEIYVLQALSGG